jgi:hypothetical protein
MASFFSNLFDKIQSVFKSKKLDDNITDFQGRMDMIITDLILPYAQPTQQLSPKDRFRDLITLLDPKQCNKIAITMSNNLDKNYTKLQLEQFASNILVGREQTECSDSTCSSNGVPSINNKDKKVSKKEICNAIAVHYVKILNLISAVLTAVNPLDNICLNRLRNLLTIISEDEQQGISGICDPIAAVVKQSIMHEPGFKELLMLYYYHLMQDTETEEEKTNVRNQYQILVKTLSNLIMFVDPVLKESPEMNSMVARELAEENNEANNTIENNLSEKENSNNTNNTNKDLDNLEKELTNAQQPAAEPAVSSNNIANIRKNISNFKASENAKLNSIITKIEGLNKVISNIQSRTQEKEVEPAPIPAPVPAPEVMPMPSGMESAPALVPAPEAMPMPSGMESAPAPEAPPMPSDIESAPALVPEPEPMASGMESMPADITDSESESESDYDSDDSDDDEDDEDDEDEEDEDDDLLGEIKNATSTASSTTPMESSSVAPMTAPMESPSVAPSAVPLESSKLPMSGPSTSPSNNTSKSTNNQTKEINDLLNEINSTQPPLQPQPQPQSQLQPQAGGADENNNNNNNNNENNGNNIINTLNTQELKTNNTLLDKFLEFVDLYSKTDEIDPKIIEIVNTAFKTYDKFSTETQLEADLRITEDDFDNFCIKNINDNAQIPITLNDPRLTDYLKIYKDLKSVYLDNCEYLLALLEKQVLIKDTAEGEPATPSRFTLREISYADLAALETDVRNRLVNMYAQCQTHYQSGIKALYTALKDTQNL